MDISVNKLLEKMAAELAEAKRVDSEAKMRERVRVIKVLCELILDETPASAAKEPSSPSFVSRTTPQKLPPQEERMVLDEANGESIFDF